MHAFFCYLDWQLAQLILILPFSHNLHWCLSNLAIRKLENNSYSIVDRYIHKSEAQAYM